MEGMNVDDSWLPVTDDEIFNYNIDVTQMAFEDSIKNIDDEVQNVFDLFTLFFTKDLVKDITNKTNSYAKF